MSNSARPDEATMKVLQEAMLNRVNVGTPGHVSIHSDTHIAALQSAVEQAGRPPERPAQSWDAQGNEVPPILTMSSPRRSGMSFVESNKLMDIEDAEIIEVSKDDQPWLHPNGQDVRRAMQAAEGVTVDGVEVENTEALRSLLTADDQTALNNINLNGISPEMLRRHFQQQRLKRRTTATKPKFDKEAERAKKKAANKSKKKNRK